RRVRRLQRRTRRMAVARHFFSFYAQFVQNIYIQAQKILRKRSNFKWKLTSVTDCAKISKNVYAMR
ncbi:MAG: hypothetical protein ACI3ZE_04350, partial [Candidatus Woodwardiibium sp.]